MAAGCGDGYGTTVRCDRHTKSAVWQITLLVCEWKLVWYGWRILILTGPAFSLKAILPGARQWLCTHTDTHTHVITQWWNQFGISRAVLLLRGVAFFTTLEVVPGHPIALLCNLALTVRPPWPQNPNFLWLSHRIFNSVMRPTFYNSSKVVPL